MPRVMVKDISASIENARKIAYTADLSSYNVPQNVRNDLESPPFVSKADNHHSTLFDY